MRTKRADGASTHAHAVIFLGPTLATLPARARSLCRASGFQVRRPVRRNDVEAFVASRKKPGLLVIVDGVFHDTLAVGHAEIREALRRGWQVWGLSSMGAIRAREMAHLGMRGYGSVFAQFVAEGDFQDDEVALLHEPTAPYRPVSEPLVHLRAAVAHLARQGIVAEADGHAVIEGLKARWYGERTVRRMAHALRPLALTGTATLERELRDFDRFRTKAIDLARFLEERPFA
jgi:hypothetical protein